MLSRNTKIFFGCVAGISAAGFWHQQQNKLSPKFPKQPTYASSATVTNSNTTATINFSDTLHHYIVVRHGQSEANVLDIVASHPAVGCSNYGLTSLGKQQATDAGNQIIHVASKYDFNTNDIYVYYSDFLRTRQTAFYICESIFGSKFWIDNNNNNNNNNLNNDSHYIESKYLRERYFGNFDLVTSEGYAKTWKLDKLNGDHTTNNVESVNSVANRFKLFIQERENDKQLQNGNGKKPKLIVMVSHGDPCTIVQSLFEKIEPSQHRSLTPISNCEIRDLTAIGKNIT